MVSHCETTTADYGHEAALERQIIYHSNRMEQRMGWSQREESP